MSIFKQSFPKCFVESADAISSSGKKENIMISEHDYYNECCNILSDANLNSKIFIRLFYYYMFEYPSIKDCSRDIKKMYKVFNIDSNQLLIYIKDLISVCVRQNKDHFEAISTEKIPTLSILIGFYCFLIYSFGLCTSNKKFYSADVVCKYKDLEASIKYMVKHKPGFSSDLELMVLKTKYSNKRSCQKV